MSGLHLFFYQFIAISLYFPRHFHLQHIEFSNQISFTFQTTQQKQTKTPQENYTTHTLKAREIKEQRSWVCDISPSFCGDQYTSSKYLGEGNGNPLQCSCLENPRDCGAQWAAIYGVAQSQTRLKQLSSSSKYLLVPQSSMMLIWSCLYTENFSECDMREDLK